MDEPLLTVSEELVAGTVVDRPNRFVVRVRFDGDPKRVFLGDPGALEGIVEPGRELLCTAVDDPERATDYDAVAAVVGDVHVSLRATLANALFEQVVTRAALSAFEGYSIERREPPLPDHGRTDFRLETPGGDPAYVEVKSCTHVERGIAKFPDRQTERGRRHLASLRSLHEGGPEAHVVFVVQRPDVERLRPFRAVDPEFAARLEDAESAGVGVHAMATAFDPPHYRLHDPALAVDLG